MKRYHWPIMFFIAVALWNIVDAGLFGFLINPPLPLYYMQDLNLILLHGHTALFFGTPSRPQPYRQIRHFTPSDTGQGKHGVHAAHSRHVYHPPS